MSWMVKSTFVKKRTWPFNYMRMLSRATGVRSLTDELIEENRRRYSFKELIQERPYLGRVWSATSAQFSLFVLDIRKTKMKLDPEKTNIS